MDKKTKKLLKKIKNKKVGVFWDDSNLYHAYQKYGWRIDVKRFKRFLQKRCDLKFINYYLAVPDKSDQCYNGTQKYIKKINPYVNVITKPLKYIQLGKSVTKKGDVDVEIVLDVVRSIKKLEVIIIVSGDSDYLELKNYILEDCDNKKVIFAGYEGNMAKELRRCWHLFLNRFKNKLILK